MDDFDEFLSEASEETVFVVSTTKEYLHLKADAQYFDSMVFNHIRIKHSLLPKDSIYLRTRNGKDGDFPIGERVFQSPTVYNNPANSRNIK